MTQARELRERRRLTFVPIQALLELRDRARLLDNMFVPGIFLEAGCALGGSAVMIAASKARARKFNVHDVFGVIPKPSAKDEPDVQSRYGVIATGEAEGFDGDAYYGYQPDLELRKLDVAKLLATMGFLARTITCTW